MRIILGIGVAIAYTFLSAWVIKFMITEQWGADIALDQIWVGLVASGLGILNGFASLLAAARLSLSWEDQDR